MVHVRKSPCYKCASGSNALLLTYHSIHLGMTEIGLMTALQGLTPNGRFSDRHMNLITRWCMMNSGKRKKYMERDFLKTGSHYCYVTVLDFKVIEKQ